MKGHNTPDCSYLQNKYSASLNDYPSCDQFSKHRNAVCKDIGKALLQIQINESHELCDWTTFIHDPYSDHLTTYRFKSVLFGATCSPYILLHAILTKHLIAKNHICVRAILKKDLFVDNVMPSFSNESSLLDYFQNTQKLMTSAAFNL
jgi:hypothetical protein